MAGETFDSRGVSLKLTVADPQKPATLADRIRRDLCHNYDQLTPEERGFVVALARGFLKGLLDGRTPVPQGLSLSAEARQDILDNPITTTDLSRAIREAACFYLEYFANMPAALSDQETAEALMRSRLSSQERGSDVD